MLLLILLVLLLRRRRLLLVLLILLLVLLFRNLVLQPRWIREARLAQEIHVAQEQLLALAKIPVSTELTEQRQALLVWMQSIGIRQDYQKAQIM